MNLKWFIAAFVGSVALAQPPAPGANHLSLVQGVVINAATKEPVRKAEVTLEFDGDSHESSLVAATDTAGVFRFADVSPGRYSLTVTKTGFLEGGFQKDDP